jgi:hypothetical protein
MHISLCVAYVTGVCTVHPEVAAEVDVTAALLHEVVPIFLFCFWHSAATVRYLMVQLMERNS